MSKSKGNVTSPLDLMKTHGAEILRLWVVLEDYRNDVSFSMESLERVSESYRKIRNTVRFLLGNLYDFKPDEDSVPFEKMGELDRWALSRTAEVLEKIIKAYDLYEYHQVYHLMVNFCGVDLSAAYFDILKDRLYTAPRTSLERRSSQTAMYWICSALARIIAPILSFTAEEVWSYLPATSDKAESVFLSWMPELSGLSAWRNPELDARFSRIWEAKAVIFKALEEARQAKTIGHPREAKVTLTLDSNLAKVLRATQEDLNRLFLVSELELKEGDSLSAQVGRASGAKCARCWTYSKAVGQFKEHPELCDRCMEAIR